MSSLECQPWINSSPMKINQYIMVKKMCLWAIAFMFNCFISNIYAQSQDTIVLPSPSFYDELKKIHPDLKYNYVHSTLIHDYSNNWDLDGDMVNDSLYFDGDDAVHIRFRLTIVLSSDNVKRQFNYIVSDFPFLSSIDKINKIDTNVIGNPYFLVGDFNNDGRQDIYLQIRKLYDNEIPDELKQIGITSTYIRIYFIQNKLHIEDFQPKK